MRLLRLRLALAIAAAEALAVFVYWRLVFGGHYDAALSADALLLLKSFLPIELLVSDGALLLMAYGLWRKQLWGYAAGFLCVGSVLFSIGHLITSMWAGALPFDLMHNLMAWPTLFGVLLATFVLYENLQLQLREGELAL